MSRGPPLGAPFPHVAHCFNALALVPGAPELAWDQFLLPVDRQDESGALPDSVTHPEVLYDFDPERVVVTADLAAFLTLQLRELAAIS